MRTSDLRLKNAELIYKTRTGQSSRRVYDLEGLSLEALSKGERSFLLKDGILQLAAEKKENHFILKACIQGDQEVKVDKFSLTFEAGPWQASFYNGFQTWTESKVYPKGEKVAQLNPLGRLFKMNRYGDYDFIKREEPYSFSYTYFKNEPGQIMLMASLTETAGYTIFQTILDSDEIEVVKDLEGKWFKTAEVLDLLIASGEEHEVFDRFKMEVVGDREVERIVGWTSWYKHYTDISEEIILHNLNQFRERDLPIHVFQIDDGYQRYVGDWLFINEKFPRGMKVIADEVKASGYKPGLWLAPFICEKKSELFKQKNEWLIKDEKGKLVPVGWNDGWSGTFYGLDIYHPEVRDYLKEVFDTVLNQWGFELVKLDFLYAVAYLPYNNKTRGEIMCDAMAFLREIIGDKLILGCGVPLSPAFSHVDYCRIGSDVASYWEDKILRFLKYKERVSTYNAIKSTMGRRHLDGRLFGNDPDVFMLREDCKMTMDERYTLFLINNVFGSLIFMSDDISEYDDDMMALYRLTFFEHKPKIKAVSEEGDRYFTAFEIGEKQYALFCNLGDRDEVFDAHVQMFGAGNYPIQLKGFFREEPLRLDRDKMLTIPPRSTRCYEIMNV